VPLTLLAFIIATNDFDGLYEKELDVSTYDVIGIIITGAGVFLYNMFEEKE